MVKLMKITHGEDKLERVAYCHELEGGKFYVISLLNASPFELDKFRGDWEKTIKPSPAPHGIVVNTHIEVEYLTPEARRTLAKQLLEGLEDEK